MLPHRIWVVKISVGREGWQSILIVTVGEKLGGFQNLGQYLKTTWSIGVQSRILQMKNATLFLPSPIYRRKPNGAQKF